MVTVLQSVKSQNLQAATTYLAGVEIQRVELLLRATRPTERPALKGTPLRRITDEHQKEETAKFERRLHRLKYQLDDDALKLVAKGRVEHVSFPIPFRLGEGDVKSRQCVYPLLYVLLKDQFEKLRRTCTQTLDEAEFQAMSTSIASIFRAVDTRRRKLKGAHLELGRLADG
jgi:soluble cytochrome b562